MGSYWRCFMPVWKNQSTNVLGIPESLCKEQMCTRMVAWEPRIPFSELPLENLMLLHFLLNEFANCVLELQGQQGVAVGVGCVKVKREFSFVFLGKQWAASVAQGIVPRVPSRLPGTTWGSKPQLPSWLRDYAGFIIAVLLFIQTDFFPDQCVFSVSSIN